MLVTYGGGIKIVLPPSCGGGERIISRRSELTVFDILTLMEEGVPCRPVDGDMPTPEWLARQEAGRRELGTLPRMCEKPFAVIGYTMMIRGESFRSDRRVPTHMVNHMSGAMSIDRIVQSAGRATFQDFGGFLERNGFSGVSVLMLKYDYETVRAYMRLMDEIKRRIVIDKHSVAQCFSADAAPYPSDLWVLLDPDQKRRIGNLREGHELTIPVDGAAERAAAAAEEIERLARVKLEQSEAKAAEKAAAAAMRLQQREEKAALREAEAQAKRELAASVAAAAAAIKSAEKEAARQKKAADAAEKKAAQALRAGGGGSVKRPRATDGDRGDDGGPSNEKRRRCKTLADVLAWAREKHKLLQLPDAAPVPVPYSRHKIQVLRCGALRPEIAFRRILTSGRGAKPVSVLLPVGYRAIRATALDPTLYSVHEVLLCTDASGAPAPMFAVWRAATVAEASGPTPAGASVADDPISACEQEKNRAAASAAEAPGAAPPVLAAGDAVPAAAGADKSTTRTASNVRHYLGYFGLDSRDVRALLELLPGLDACRATPEAYRTLQEDEERARDAAAGAGGAASGAATPAVSGISEMLSPTPSFGFAGVSGSLAPAMLFGTPLTGTPAEHVNDAAIADDASGPA